MQYARSRGAAGIDFDACRLVSVRGGWTMARTRGISDARCVHPLRADAGEAPFQFPWLIPKHTLRMRCRREMGVAWLARAQGSASARSHERVREAATERVRDRARCRT